MLLALCYGCCHPIEQPTTTENTSTNVKKANDGKRSITQHYKSDFIFALYFLDCNERLQLGLPDSYEENAWDFVNTVIDSVESSDYFARIEANLSYDPFHEYLEDSINRWLFLCSVVDYPFYCDLAYPEDGIIDQLPQTHHIFEKRIDRTVQEDVQSLSTSQMTRYYYDIISFLFSLPNEEQMDFIIDYYTKVRNTSKIE